MTLQQRYEAWLQARKWFAENDGLSIGPEPEDWQRSDDEAVELLHEAMTHVVIPYDRQWDNTNDALASMVMPYVEAYSRAYYHGSTEPLGTVITDMITNLFHLADRVTANDPDEPDDPLGADLACNRAYSDYLEEVEKELEQVARRVPERGPDQGAG